MEGQESGNFPKLFRQGIPQCGSLTGESTCMGGCWFWLLILYNHSVGNEIKAGGGEMSHSLGCVMRTIRHDRQKLAVEHFVSIPWFNLFWSGAICMYPATPGGRCTISLESLCGIRRTLIILVQNLTWNHVKIIYLQPSTKACKCIDNIERGETQLYRINTVTNCAGSSSENNFRNALKPVLRKSGVDIVLTSGTIKEQNQGKSAHPLDPVAVSYCFF